MRQALSDYFLYYNTDRLHQNLEYNTPLEIYHGEVKLDNYFDKLTSIIL